MVYYSVAYVKVARTIRNEPLTDAVLEAEVLRLVRALREKRIRGFALMREDGFV